jgi:hypothetical protein
MAELRSIQETDLLCFCTPLADCFNEFVQGRSQNPLQSTPGALHFTKMLG